MLYTILRGRWCPINALNSQAPTEDKLTNVNEISNDNGVRVVNFATSKNLTVKSTIFPHRNIHKNTWTSLNGKTHNHIDHILIDRQRHSSVLDV
jgi:hypothetical protein